MHMELRPKTFSANGAGPVAENDLLIVLLDFVEIPLDPDFEVHHDLGDLFPAIGTLLDTVADGLGKVGRVLDDASWGDSIALWSSSLQVAPAHPTKHFRFQQSTAIAVFIIIDPVDGGRRKGSSRRGAASVLLLSAA